MPTLSLVGSLALLLALILILPVPSLAQSPAAQCMGCPSSVTTGGQTYPFGSSSNGSPFGSGSTYLCAYPFPGSPPFGGGDYVCLYDCTTGAGQSGNGAYCTSGQKVACTSTFAGKGCSALTMKRAHVLIREPKPASRPIPDVMKQRGRLGDYKQAVRQNERPGKGERRAVLEDDY